MWGAFSVSKFRSLCFGLKTPCFPARALWAVNRLFSLIVIASQLIISLRTRAYKYPVLFCASAKHGAPTSWGNFVPPAVSLPPSRPKKRSLFPDSFFPGLAVAKVVFYGSIIAEKSTLFDLGEYPDIVASNLRLKSINISARFICSSADPLVDGEISAK